MRLVPLKRLVQVLLVVGLALASYSSSGQLYWEISTQHNIPLPTIFARGVVNAQGPGTSWTLNFTNANSGVKDIVGLTWCYTFDGSNCVNTSGGTPSSVVIDSTTCTAISGASVLTTVIPVAIYQCNGMSSGAHTLTVTFSSNVYYVTRVVSECVNCGINPEVAHGLLFNNVTGISVSTNGSTTGTGELIYGFGSDDYGSVQTVSPLIALNGGVGTTDTGTTDGYYIAATPGSYTVSFSCTQCLTDGFSAADFTGIVVGFPGGASQPPHISSVAISPLSFTAPLSPGALEGTITVNCDVGTCSGATSALSSAAGTPCAGTPSGGNGSFTVSGASLNAGASTVNAGTYLVCLRTDLTNASNTPVYTAFTLTGS
jgi:hypothetical protein